MINKNQFEKSIIFLKDSVSVFVYKAYSEFITYMDELSSIYTNAASQGCSFSPNESCKILFDDGTFLTAYLKAVAPDVALLRLKDTCLRLTIDDSQDRRMTPDEQFYNVTSADIYAPVSTIDASVFPNIVGNIGPAFAGDGYYVEDKEIYIKFEIDIHGSVTSEWADAKDLMNKDLSFRYGTVSGINGDDTVLDHLRSKCSIDLTSLFKSFFSNLAFAAPVMKGEGPIEIERLNLLVSKAKEKEISEPIINQTIKELTSKIIATYLVFASKLHGTKNDVYTWAYTSFVKDSVSNIDKTYYPTNAPVTISSGHGIDGKAHGVSPDKISDPVMDQITTELNEFGDGALRESTKKLIYRSIRLQYSTWATIISAILSTKNASANYYDNTIELKASASTQLISDQYSYILLFVKRVLYGYLCARYRTYNTSIQLDLGANPYQSSKAGSEVVSVIKDETAVAYLKEISKSAANDNKRLFVDTNGLWLSILKADKVSVQLLAKLFLQASYLLMLSKIHAKVGTFLDDIDNSTGKTKASLYEEIYYGVANNITSDIAKYSSIFDTSFTISDKIDESYTGVIKDTINLFTPFLSNFDLAGICAGKKYPSMVISDNYYPESLKKYSDLLQKSPLTKQEQSDLIGRIINIPIKADFNYISDFAFSTSGHQVYTNQNSSLFPKNKIVLDSIRTMNSKDTYLFKSLEAVDNNIEELDSMLDLSSEAADGMANNGCYNALASIGSGVCSIEIHSEEEPNKLTTDADIPETKIDADGNVIRPDSSTPEDQMFLTTESAHIKAEQDTEKRIIDNISNKYGFLFNKYVLGMNQK